MAGGLRTIHSRGYIRRDARDREQAAQMRKAKNGRSKVRVKNCRHCGRSHLLGRCKKLNAEQNAYLLDPYRDRTFGNARLFGKKSSDFKPPPSSATRGRIQAARHRRITLPLRPSARITKAHPAAIPQRGSSIPLTPGGGVRRASLSAEVAPIPRLALTREEAAASLGMSLDSFERHVQPTIRMLRLGRIRLVPITELQRWLEENAERTL